jgi:RNA polymerase sigma-70 factor (ECF subfamily)
MALALVLVGRPMAPALADADLAQLIAAGGDLAKRAEAELYTRFARRIELYGLKYLGDRASAEDLVQKVMLRVLQALRAGRVENPASVASFVLGTCRNVTWDSRRAGQRQREIERHASMLTPILEPSLLTEFDVARLFSCISGLPEREAMVIRMSFLEDRSADEIGQRLELTPGNVRVIRHRALAKLAVCMNPEDEK